MILLSWSMRFSGLCSVSFYVRSRRTAFSCSNLSYRTSIRVLSALVFLTFSFFVCVESKFSLAYTTAHDCIISLMAEWLEHVSQCHEMYSYCRDLEVMSSNPGWVELGARGTSVLSRTLTNKQNILILAFGLAFYTIKKDSYMHYWATWWARV